jgi:hypothetical protein
MKILDSLAKLQGRERTQDDSFEKAALLSQILRLHETPMEVLTQ